MSSRVGPPLQAMSIVPSSVSQDQNPEDRTQVCARRCIKGTFCVGASFGYATIGTGASGCWPAAVGNAAVSAVCLTTACCVARRYFPEKDPCPNL